MTKPQRKIALWLCAWLVACILTGCDSTHRLPTYPVLIVITYPDGTPLAGGHVTLRSLDHGVSASGAIDLSGQCRVGTYQTDDGAVGGQHQVAVIPSRSPGDPDKVAAVQRIHANYLDPRTSGLLIDVKPEGTNEFSLSVTLPAP